MSLRSLIHWSLRLVLALCLVASGAVVGANRSGRSSNDAAPAATAQSKDATDLPCHGANVPDDDAPCDCCPQRSCDAPLCALAACIPAPFRAAAAALAAAPQRPLTITPASARHAPPLRPPIA